jgi:ferredoxin
LSTAKTDASTMTEVRLVIDGKDCAAREGETVLDVARNEGIDIPALCQMEGTAPWGACRLCLVEVEGAPKLQAACTTWASDGMKVKTDTPRVRAKRESYLRMYLSDHNAYCEAPTRLSHPHRHPRIPGGARGGRRGQGDRDRTCRTALPRHTGPYLSPVLRTRLPTR